MKNGLLFSAFLILCFSPAAGQPAVKGDRGIVMEATEVKVYNDFPLETKVEGFLYNREDGNDYQFGETCFMVPEGVVDARGQTSAGQILVVYTPPPHPDLRTNRLCPPMLVTFVDQTSFADWREEREKRWLASECGLLKEEAEACFKYKDPFAPSPF